MKKISGRNFFLRNLLLFVLGIIAEVDLNAQIPVITSFSPASGPIGTTVTITGGNFSATPANNIVRFGAVKATVTAATTTQLAATVPTSATLQPISVTTGGNTVFTNKPFIVTFPSSHVIDSSAFATEFDFTPVTSLFGVVIGDIDGDGKPDLIIINNTGNSISICRNISSSGSITAGSFSAKVDFSTGSGPCDVAIGDIDGDGKPDMVVINFKDNTVSVFRNTSTPGSITSSSFSASVNFGTGLGPASVIICDVDGNGKPDIVVTNYFSNTISVFRNTSTSGTITSGSFAARVDFTSGSNPNAVAISDIDGDSKPDLIVTNTGSNTVSVFRNTSTSGSITSSSFAAKADFITGSHPIGLALGDIDSDGKPDMVVGNDNTVSIFRNTSISGTIGAGSFAIRVDMAVATTVSSGVSLGDIDGDGKPDLIVANNNSNTVSILKNLSTSGSITTGSFAAGVDFITGSGPGFAFVCDIDGDGKPDLIVSRSGSNTISMLRNTIAVSLTNFLFTPTAGPVGTTVTITGTNFSTTLTNNNVWFGAVKATVTAATAKQLTVIVPTGATYQPITVTVNGFTEYSNMPFNVTFLSTQAVDASLFASKVDFTAGTSPEGIAISDIDGDGKPDVIVTNQVSGNVSVFRNVSSSGSISGGSFSNRVDFPASWPHAVTIGDIDGDGKPDMIVTNFAGNTVSVFRNNSISGSITTSSFDTKVDFPTGAGPYGVAIGDIDGDGKPDLVVLNYSDNTVSVYKNTSTTGIISTGSFAARIDFSSGSGPTAISVGDLDGDNKPDLVVTNSGSGNVSVFRNTSTPGSITSGSFATRVDFTTGTNPYQVAICDVDGDGKPDLAVTNTGSNTISVFRNISTPGNFTTSSFATKVDFNSGSNPRGISFTDINGDGKPDLIVANQFIYTVSVFRNTSSPGLINASSFAAMIDFPTGNGPYGVAISDIDGDGKPDLVLASSQANSITVLRNTIASISPPSAPTLQVITQPTCSLTSGTVVLGNLPSTGTWTITETPLGNTISGSGTTTTIPGLSPGTYTFSVTVTQGYTSPATANVVINSIPTGFIPIIKAKWNDVLICYNLNDSISTYQWYKGSSAISGGTSRYYISNKQPGAYKVQITDINGCVNFSNSVQISGTKSFSVYPNPARENISVNLYDDPVGKAVITLINGSGTKVMEVKTEKEFSELYQVIPVSSLNDGVYYVIVTVNQVNVYKSKIVILK